MSQLIHLDSGYDRQQQAVRDASLKKMQTTSPLDVKQVITSAMRTMKIARNKNYHMQEEIYKQISKRQSLSRSPNRHQKTTASAQAAATSKPFAIEHIFSPDNAHSKLKQCLTPAIIQTQRSRIYHTLRAHQVPSNEFGNLRPKEDIAVIAATATGDEEDSRHESSTVLNTSNSLIKEKISHLQLKNPTAASAYYTRPQTMKHASGIFLLTNVYSPVAAGGQKIISPSISLRSLNKTRRLFDQDTTDTTMSDRINLSISTVPLTPQLPKSTSTPYLMKGTQSMSTRAASANHGRYYVKVDNHHHHLSSREDQQNTAVKAKFVEVGTSPLTDQSEVLIQDEVKDEEELCEDISSQKISSHQRRAAMITSSSFATAAPSSSTSESQSKPVYYIDNNEMQSVKEFMFRLQKYQAVKRFETKLAEKDRKHQQIKEVQRLLTERQMKAEREIAMAKMRRLIRKNKLDINKEELEDLIDEQQLAKPVGEVNRRLTFRETDRQIVSLQTKATDEEKAFQRIQKEIGIALSKINQPVKFKQQFDMHTVNKANNYKNQLRPESQTSSVAIINLLSERFLTCSPPSTRSIYMSIATPTSLVLKKNYLELVQPSINEYEEKDMLKAKYL